MQSPFTPFMANAEFADIASQLEEILSELNQVSNPTLRRRMLASIRLLMKRLQCTEEQLVDALTGRAQPVPREMLALQLSSLLEDQQSTRASTLLVEQTWLLRYCTIDFLSPTRQVAPPRGFK